jgi:hypothetical protein
MSVVFNGILLYGKNCSTEAACYLFIYREMKFNTLFKNKQALLHATHTFGPSF